MSVFRYLELFSLNCLLALYWNILFPLFIYCFDTTNSEFSKKKKISQFHEYMKSFLKNKNVDIDLSASV